MNRALRAYCTVGVGLALAMSACASNIFGSPCPIPDKATDEQKQAALNGCNPGILADSFDARAHKEVDILFAIDNSTSMAPKQQKIAANINAFIEAINGFDADLHIGVVTSDVGSYTAEGAQWGSFIQGCGSFKGDDGQLQVRACGTRLTEFTSPEAKNTCQTGTVTVNGSPAPFCPDALRNLSSVTTDGKPFITKINGQTNVVGGNTAAALADAFRCMAFVGDGGCGIEGQLESVKRALDGHNPKNAGFLSDGAYLAVIFITDEDDCSVADRAQNNPITRDCTTPDGNASYDCFNYDYRCLARSVQCDEPMNVTGDKHNCKERPNNYLIPTKTYHDFLVNVAGGESKLLVNGFWSVVANPMPNDQTPRPLNLETGAKLNVNYQGTGSASSNLNRAGGTLASCVSSSDTTIFGQAQRRLSAFATSFGTSKDMAGNTVQNVPEYSICSLEPDNVKGALGNIATAIQKKLQPFCLPQQPKVLSTGPNCLVGDVDSQTPSALPDTYFPQCSATCCAGWASSTTPTPADKAVSAACAAETKDCFCAIKNTAGACDAAGLSGWVGGVSRAGGGDPPPGKIISFRCAKGP